MIGSSHGCLRPNDFGWVDFSIHFCCVSVRICVFFSPSLRQESRESAQNQRSFCFNLSFLQITVEIKEEERENFLELLRNATPACEVVSTTKVNGRSSKPVSAVKDHLAIWGVPTEYYFFNKDDCWDLSYNVPGDRLRDCTSYFSLHANLLKPSMRAAINEGASPRRKNKALNPYC